MAAGKISTFPLLREAPPSEGKERALRFTGRRCIQPWRLANQHVTDPRGDSVLRGEERYACYFSTSNCIHLCPKVKEYHVFQYSYEVRGYRTTLSGGRNIYFKLLTRINRVLENSTPPTRALYLRTQRECIFKVFLCLKSVGVNTV